MFKREKLTLQRGALALKEKDLVLQEGSLALQRGNPSTTRRSNPSTTRRENSSRLVSIYSQFFRFSIIVFVYAGKITIKTKLDEKLEGVDNL